MANEEYLRRNMQVAKAAGANANATVALRRLRGMNRPPQWMVACLLGIIERTEGLSHELSQWRDQSPDAPSYAKPLGARDCPYCNHTGTVHCGDVADKIRALGGEPGDCSNAKAYGMREGSEL
jgi:hypothetical protein